ncbi:hypothetical protein GQ53DRAFT_822651 [Thozetella sp. PMI_491]|nr:hypothetical protein GQ53DRAFT_822651 [Thozetella sp. PMI_491]
MVKPVAFLALFAVPALGQWRGRPTRRPITVPPAAPTSTVVVINPSIQSLYGQCGGQTWDGPKACTAGAYCKNDGNPWYSQCVLPEAQDDGSDNPRTTIVTRTLTTVFTIVGPTPTRVSTYITFLTPKPTTTFSLTPDDPYN